jgi:hypothetical protein
MRSTSKIGHRRKRASVTLAAVVSLLAAALVGVGGTPAQAADESVSVDFSTEGGSPTYRASGWIYGMTEDGKNPPDHFFTDVKFQAMRAGGAQLPGGGWQGGGYDRRWNATRAQILRTNALGGKFVLLVHDLWGADGAPISRFPGDNGDWTDYDNFLTRLFNDVRATGVPVEWDLWNEPNITLFWNRPQSQYFELWRRTYQRVRAAFPTHLIVGPSCACVPSITHAFWNQYLDFVRANDVVPDIISWHSLPGDPVANVAAANATLDPRGIPHPRPYQINEYAAPDQQNPSGGAWYISRLERAGADGLRANWAGGQNLHNDLASLLIRAPSGQYQPGGEWWAYRFYGQQTGQITSVTPSASYDAFATKDTGVAKVLIGGNTTGNIEVNLQRLDATSGLVQEGQVRMVVQQIPYNDGGAVQGPITIRDSVVALSENATTVLLPHANARDAFTITLLPPSDRSFQSVAVAQHSQQCLDNTDLSAADGNQQQYYCDGGDQQLWNFRPVASVPNTYTLANQQSGRCLGISGEPADGAPLIESTCTNGPYQRFTLRKVIYTGNDSHDYQIVLRDTDLCAAVGDSSTAPGAPVRLSTCNPASQGGPLNQTWRLWGRPSPVGTALTADEITLPAGGSTTVTITVQNLDSSQLANLRASVTLADGWQAEPSGTQLSRLLAPGATTTQSWKITAPSSIDTAVTRQPVNVVLDFVRVGMPYSLTSSLTLSVINPLTSLASFGSVPSLFGEFGSAYTIITSGADIWTGPDEYGAIYQAKAAGTSSTITARVTHMDNTDPWAKAGVVIRSDLTRAGSSAGYAVMVVTPGNGANLQWDANGDGHLDSFSGAGRITAPAWVRLVRTGSQVSGYYSTDGSSWTKVGPTVTLPGMTEQLDAGMIATSHNSGVTGQFDFSDFSVTP